MIGRKNKVRIAQASLLFVSIFVIFFTYFNKEPAKEKIISSTDKKKIKIDKRLSEKVDVFYNIKYTGLDLSGNRYVLTSKEAIVDKNLKEIVNMSYVNAVFYFKDNTNLVINSDKGIYNNKSLDMIFEKNVEAKYEGSELFGEKITYLNSKRILEITDNVKLRDIRGTMFADKLLFDLEKKKVDISSEKNKINTNINLK